MIYLKIPMTYLIIHFILTFWLLIFFTGLLVNNYLEVRSMSETARKLYYEFYGNEDLQSYLICGIVSIFLPFVMVVWLLAKLFTYLKNVDE